VSQIASLFFLIFVTTQVSHATFTITSISGVSYSDPIVGTAPPTVYGGIAGACTTTSTSETCNSCVDSTPNPARACNLKSVHPSLIITVNFTSSTELNNVTVSLKTETAGGGSTDVLNSGTFSGTSGSLTTTWGAVCDKDTTFDSSCVPTAGTIVNFEDRGLIIESDLDLDGTVEDGEKVRAPIKFQYLNTTDDALNGQTYNADSCTGAQKGACGFVLKPGDEKVFIESFAVAGTATSPTNDTGAPAWYGLVFFKVNGDTASSAQVANNSSEPIVKLYDSSFGISDSALSEGFENYTKSCLIMGNMNKAQNIYYFTTANDDTKTCATPSEVVGILDDKNCFISTAAFGSDMAPEVEIFRQFRNHFLLTNALGRKFVKMYYAYSPPLANIIAKNGFLKKMTRAALYPLLFFSKGALKFGVLETLLATLCFMILFTNVSRFLLRNKKFLIVVLLLGTVQLRAEIESGTKKIQHPGAAEGLVKIKKDGSYIYNVEYGLKNKSGHIRFGQASHPDISIVVQTLDSSGASTGENTLYFEDFYGDASNFIISYDYEYFPWVEKNMLGLQAGVGLMYADGHGRLITGSPGDLNPEANEKYIFVTVPMSLGAVYRLQWTARPWFAPYVAGGGTYVGLAEKREDKSTPNFAGGFGFYATGGVLVNLAKFNAETAFDLNSEYGIGNLWFSLEYKMTEVDSGEFTFINRYVNGGLSFDF